VDGKKQKYGVCENIGAMPFSRYCQKEPREGAKEIGLGPTLFLMQTKALAWIFFVLTIINIPLFIFFTTANK
jgi:hypothetical protein